MPTRLLPPDPLSSAPLDRVARWRLRDDGPDSAIANMATDLALLDLAGTDGTATLRTYRWRRPTVSFGRHERVQGAWDVRALEAAGFDLVRRPTGGRALLHARELTWSVTLPLPRAVPWRVAYDAVNARLVAALAMLGVPATLVADAPALAPDGPACFAAPADGEIAVGGRKLVGSAVWRSATAYLQHGSILLHDVQGVLATFRRPGARDAAVRPAAGLAALVAHDGPAAAHAPGDAVDVAEAALTDTGADDALRRRLTDALREQLTGRPAAASAPPRPAVERARYERVRYEAHRAQLADPSWLWRR